MRWVLLILSVFGIMLAIIGWGFDKATNFDFLIKRISPDYVDGINALDLLSENPARNLNSKHPGFTVLLDRWPDNPEKRFVFFISRSVAYIELGPRIKNDFQLILRDQQHNEIKPCWSEVAARSKLVDELNRKILKFGAIIFCLGVAISLISSILQFSFSNPNKIKHST